MFARQIGLAQLLVLLAGLAFAADTAKDKLKLAKEAYEKSEFDKMLVLMKEAVQLDPTDAETQLWCGKAYDMKLEIKKSKEHYDKAISLLTEAIQRDPKNVQAYLRRGEAHDRKGSECEKAMA